nr:tRNA nucleotidyltransferase [Theileria orientalis]
MTEEVTHGVSPVATAVVLGLFSLVFLILYILKFRKKPSLPPPTEGGSTSYSNPTIHTLDETERADESGANENEEEEGKSKKPLKAKQRKRMEMKEEMRRLKALQDEEKEEKRKQMAMKQEQIEAKRLEREKLLQEQEQKKREEEEKAYQELASTFVVESEGTIAEANQYTVDDFINYIVSKKLSNVEELSVRFSLKSNEIIKRIQELEEQDRLFGLLDDQGRYIHITDEEAEAVIRYLKTKGKLHKQKDLVNHFNAIISLESKLESTAVDLEDD